MTEEIAQPTVMTVYEVLNKIQRELKAPKTQLNVFGKYKYRSCEDILEAVKPLLGEATLRLWDDVILLGDRYYIKATVELRYGKELIFVTAFAREETDKKGMDASQITGAASSYARKYALNGLFLIDDTKDADTVDNTDTKTKKPTIAPEPPPTPSPVAPEPPQMLLPISSSLHKQIEVKIGEASIDRNLFKQWLLNIGKISFLDERPSFKTMTSADAESMIAKWDKVLVTYNKWLTLRLLNIGKISFLDERPKQGNDPK